MIEWHQYTAGESIKVQAEWANVGDCTLDVRVIDGEWRWAVVTTNKQGTIDGLVYYVAVGEARTIEEAKALAIAAVAMPES